ncbi:hypothetical protein [Tomitella gaofuii]|uniref:hypothetical protein n=1 Tax=Tomitella gaofuii TaxID=2760083 RepID=UPI0015FC1ACB|nr:hypothetical protein [Tomitella gaofuii]
MTTTATALHRVNLNVSEFDSYSYVAGLRCEYENSPGQPCLRGILCSQCTETRWVFARRNEIADNLSDLARDRRATVRTAALAAICELNW